MELTFTDACLSFGVRRKTLVSYIMADIKKETFTVSKGGFFTARRESKMLKKATDQAQEWINAHSEYKIKDISMCLGSMTATVIVWYYETE